MLSTAINPNKADIIPTSHASTTNPPIPQSPYPTPPNTTIRPVTSATLPAYRRLITSLLPIRYQDKYYAESIANPTSSSLALCALWHDPSTPYCSSSTPLSLDRESAQVVAGIQCRLEPLPPSSPSSNPPPNKPPPYHHPPVSPPPTPSSTTTTTTSSPTPHNLYISTLCTLAPHRGLGIATALLNHIIYTALTHPSYAHIIVQSIYAHVWEANTEALEWYTKRGFMVEGGVVEGYYRRLRPMGGRVVRRRIGVGDYLRAGGRGAEWVKGDRDGEGGRERGEGGG